MFQTSYIHFIAVTQYEAALSRALHSDNSSVGAILEYLRITPIQDTNVVYLRYFLHSTLRLGA